MATAQGTETTTSITESMQHTGSHEHIDAHPIGADRSREQKMTNGRESPATRGQMASDSGAEKDFLKDGVPATNAPPPKSAAFWMILLSLGLTVFASSSDMSILTTSLPTVMDDIGTSASRGDYVWINSVYLLTGAVFIPTMGQLANIFGRRWLTIISLAFFALGAGIAGGANSASMLIAGRALQGVGFGGIMLFVDIIIADLLPVRERQLYIGLVGMWAAIGTVVGPVIGGAFVSRVSWRWAFYFNLPISGAAMVSLFIFLRVEYPKNPTWQHALMRIDWLGNVLFIGSMTSLLYGVIQGGTVHPWNSAQIIVPIVVGAVGWIAFHVQQLTPLSKEKIVPARLFQNRTSGVAYILAFLSQLLIMWVWLILPLYFQSVLDASPIRSGAYLLPYMAVMVPTAIVVGGLITKFGRFRRFHVLAFFCLTLSNGLFVLLDRKSPKVEFAWFEIINAIGQGAILMSLIPGIQGSLPESEVAASTGFYAFVRQFASVWGAVIPSVIFNSEFDRRAGQISDPAVQSALDNGNAYSYASSSYIHTLPTTTRNQVTGVYVHAIKMVWYAGLAFAAFGLILSPFEKHVDLRTELETQYGLEEKSKAEDVKLEDGI